MVSIEDFMKFELAVGRVKEAKAHPNADRLLVLQVDLGKEQRQLVAGIKRSYMPEELVGKQVVVICNLEPATIRGVKSQGMVLAASDDQGVSIIRPERHMALGSGVR